MSDTTTAAPDDAPLDENKEPTINTVAFKDIPDNTFTMILKAHGKVYALGGEIGDVKTDIPDEDLNATLRALQGAALTVQRTLAIRIAGRDDAYPLPGESADIEENLAPKADIDATGVLYIAGTKIEQGQALHLDVDGKVYPISRPAEPSNSPDSTA